MAEAEKLNRCHRLARAKNNYLVQKAMQDAGKSPLVAWTEVPRFVDVLTASPEECAINKHQNCSIVFSRETFEQALFLKGKGVRLDAWVSLCYEVFTSLLESDLSRVEMKVQDASARLETKIKSKINKQDWGLPSCKSYAHIVMVSYLEFCFQERLRRRFLNLTNSVEASLMTQIFDKGTLDKANYLMSNGVRVDLWVRLCYQAYRCFWGEESPRSLLKSERSKADDEIRKLVDANGEFWPLSGTRLPEFLRSYLHQDNHGGVPRGRKSV